MGDPSGRSSTRPQLSGEEIDRNAQTFSDQAFRVLDDDPSRLEVRRNGEWLDMSMEDLLRLAATTTVAQLLERDDFDRRHRASEPISILELLYPLMQGYDSVAVRADVELGGTDQKFNLLLGRDIQRAYGQPEQAILTMPILVGTDGRDKMSKSLGNQIGVTEAPDEIYGKTLRVPDTALDAYYGLLLGREPPAELGRATPSGLWPASWLDGSGGPRPPSGPRPTSTGCSWPGSCPRMCPRRASRRPMAACTCPRCWPRCSAYRARTPGG